MRSTTPNNFWFFQNLFFYFLFSNRKSCRPPAMAAVKSEVINRSSHDSGLWISSGTELRSHAAAAVSSSSTTLSKISSASSDSFFMKSKESLFWAWIFATDFDFWALKNWFFRRFVEDHRAKSSLSLSTSFSLQFLRSHYIHILSTQRSLFYTLLRFLFLYLFS